MKSKDISKEFDDSEFDKYVKNKKRNKEIDKRSKKPLRDKLQTK